LKRFSKGKTISSPHQKRWDYDWPSQEDIEHCEVIFIIRAVRINKANGRQSEFKSGDGFVGSNYKKERSQEEN